jgi:hypothetical protein
LDEEYPDGGGGVVAWTSKGYDIHSDGYGCFGIKQGTGADGVISFSLILAGDDAAVDEDGLVMNSFNENSVTAEVETGEGISQNQLTGFDPRQWHEFWITIQTDTTNIGTHLIRVWMDGNAGDPWEFIVTAGDKDEYDFNGYLVMALGTTSRTGSQDVDFFAYRVGLVAPTGGNIPPIVDAGTDQEITWPIRSVNLDGTAEDDGIGEPNGFLEIMWSIVSGPGTVTFEPNEFIGNPRAIFSSVGEYVLKLSASDGQTDAYDEVTITVLEPDCPVGDMDENCIVNFQDLRFFVGQWLDNTACIGFGCPDLDGVNGVDAGDYALLARNWLERWLGSLRVTIVPQEAIDAGAQWRVDGGTWRNSGYTETNLPAGLHTVDFKAITDWIKPDEQTVRIIKDQVFPASGIYKKKASFFGLYVSEVQVRSDSATGQDVKNRTGVKWDSPAEFVENWLVGYLGVNFADIVLYQAGDGVNLNTLMFEVDDIAEDNLVDGTLVGIRGKSMDAWGGGGGPEALLEAAGEHGVAIAYNIQPKEMTQDQIVGVISAAFYRFASYPGFLGMVVDCEFCDTMETGGTWRENELLRAQMLRRACAVRDHYEGIYGRNFYIFGVWYRTAYGGARPWHIYFPDVNDLDGFVPMYDGADDNIGSSVDQWLAGGAASPKDFGIKETGHCLFLRKKVDGNWVQLDGDIILGMCEASSDAGNDFIEAEYWYHVVKGTGGWERCYGPEIKDAAALILHASVNYNASDPHPADGAVDVDPDAVLSWSPGDFADSHDVYFGTSSPGTFQGNQTATTFDPGTMAAGTTYYWRIDEVGAYGTITGTIWSFTTMAPQASNPNPPDGATGVSTTADLSWTADPGAASHDVYFGTTSPPPFIQNQTATTFDPGTMAYSTKYYWRIDEVGTYGTITGTVWSFWTTISPPPPQP